LNKYYGILNYKLGDTRVRNGLEYFPILNCLVLVGSRIGFESNFAIKLNKIKWKIGLNVK